ncbi:MAG: hypothetical protein GOV00_02910 [Candidatus Altiarchaeota archaeon]|nr:hypothetical protein [Candidatus Altiarchaeota archaeon]
MERIKPLLCIVESKSCRVVFVLALILGYILTPKRIFHQLYTLLGIAFIINFALLVTCIFKNIHEKTKLATPYKGMTISTIATTLGFTSLQLCSVGASFCGASLGSGIIALMLPLSVMHFISEYAVQLIIFSIAVQTWAMVSLGCVESRN